MKTNLLLTTLLLSILNFWPGNNDLTAQSIVGKWLFSSGSETVEFTEKGVFRVFIENEGYSYGMYKLNNNALGFSFFDMDQTFSYTLKKPDKKQLVLFNQATNEQMHYSYLGKHEIPPHEIDLIFSLIDYNKQAEEDYSWAEDPKELSNDNFEQANYDLEKPEENKISENSNTEDVQFEPEQAELPTSKEYPSTVPSNSNIAGTWYSKEYNITLTLTNDHYFVKSIMADESVRNIYPDPEVSHGKYKFDGNKLSLLTFSNTLSGEEEILVENLNQSGFRVPIDFYGQKNYQMWIYNGAPRLSQYDKEMFLSWTNYLKLPGQWRAKDEILKFMGESIVFAGKPGSSGSMLVYGVAGNTLEVSEFGAAKDQYIYTGKIMEFTDHKLVLKDNKDGTIGTYVQDGKPKLTEQEIALYSRYLQMQHRTTMDIIDVMDGVKDWKWVEKKY